MKLNRKIIYVAGFIFSLPIALTSYINSSFLEGYVNTYWIGTIYIVGSLLSIWGFLEMPKIMTRIGNRMATLLFCLLTFFSLVTLAFADQAYIVVPAFILFFVANGFIIASLDIFIEDFSKGSSIGGFRGFYLMIINSAWVVAQIISGTIIKRSSYTGIYLISAFFMIVVAGIFVFFLHKFKDPHYKKVSIRKTITFFIENKHVSKIYLINLLLKFFFAWMIIYTPLYLHEYLNLDWEKIGMIFTIMLVPFVLLSYPLGKLSDKIGEKQFIKLGFLISALSTIIIPIITTPTVWILALVLFLTRVGAATIEVMSESYFFKSVTEENADAISFFRNTTPISYIIAPMLALPILYFTSFQYIFFVLGGFMLLGYLVTSRLEDVT